MFVKRFEIVNSEASAGFLCRTVDAGVCELLVERCVDVRLENQRRAFTAQSQNCQRQITDLIPSSLPAYD